MTVRERISPNSKEVAALTRPAWHLVSTPRPSASASLRVDPATPSLSPHGISMLRDERGVTIEIPASVRTEIARLCAEHPDLETGGALLSEGLSLGTRIAIARAGAPGRSFKRLRSSITFDPRELDDDRLVGLWHSHPRGGDRLSPSDIDSFRRMRHGGRRPIPALSASPSRRGAARGHPRRPLLLARDLRGPAHPRDARAAGESGSGESASLGSCAQTVSQERVARARGPSQRDLERAAGYSGIDRRGRRVRAWLRRGIADADRARRPGRDRRSAVAAHGEHARVGAGRRDAPDPHGRTETRAGSCETASAQLGSDLSARRPLVSRLVVGPSHLDRSSRCHRFSAK